MNRWLTAAVGAALSAAVAGALWLTFSEPKRAAAPLVVVDLTPALNAYRQGDFKTSARLYEDAIDASSDPSEAVFFAGLSRHMMGEYEAAIRHFERAEAMGSRPQVARYNIGCGQAMLGMSEEALDSLEKAFAMGYRNQAQYSSDPDLLMLREHPRFEALLAQMASPLAGKPSAMALVDLEGVWETSPGEEGSRFTVRPILQGRAVQFTLSDLVGGITEGMFFFVAAKGSWSAEAVMQAGGHMEWTGQANPDTGQLEFSGTFTDLHGESRPNRFLLIPQGKDRLRIEESQDWGEGWQPSLTLDLVRTSG